MSKLFKKKTKAVDDIEVIETPTQLWVKRFRKNKLAMAGLFIFLGLIAIIFISWVYIEINNYNLANLDHANQYSPPSWQYPFGTDKQGRNYFLRTIYGGLISLQVALIATSVAIALGILVGGIAGFYGGKIDTLLMRLTEIVSSFPFLPVAYTVSMILIDMPNQRRLYIMMVIIGLLGWTGLARMVRGQILSLREQEFMLATKAMGLKTWQKILKHLIPNVIPYVIVSATTTFASAILTESTLSYLGLSVQEPIPTWGGLLSRSNSSMLMRNYWWMWVFPGLLLFLLIMSINLIGEGLRDAVDPKAHVKFRTQKKDRKSIFKKSKKVAS